MQMSELQLTKRRLLGGAAIAAAALTLAACSDGKEAAEAGSETKTMADGTKVDTISTAATGDIPKADRDVDMAAALKPGNLPEMAMGKPDAPVKIIEYYSMTCPHCAHFETVTLPEITKKYVDTGKVYFIFREFPFDPAATAAFMLARCAPKDEYFPFISMMFKQQRAWAAPSNGDVRGAMLQMSKLAGFTQDSFESCLTNQQLANDVSAVRDRGAKEFGVNATPTFLINGKSYSGDMSVESMSALIDSLL